MNYNNEFNISDLIYDKKYRSRLILGVYFVLFLVLILIIRIGDNKAKELNNNEIENSNTIESNNAIDDDTNEIEIDELDKKFSYILKNNYNFEYNVEYNDNIYISKGKRFNDKQEFVFGNNEPTLKYHVDGNLVEAKILNSEYEYRKMQLPYFYINYYNSNILRDIIKKSAVVEENVYEISNKDLYEFIESELKKEIDINDATNEIQLTLKNNNITEINLDITNLVRNIENEEINSAKISLKYNNFGLIDEF